MLSRPIIRSTVIHTQVCKHVEMFYYDNGHQTHDVGECNMITVYLLEYKMQCHILS